MWQMAGSVILGRCALCLYDRAGGGSDSCDAATFVCCHERRGREVLGIQWKWAGDASCYNAVFFRISVVLGFVVMLFTTNNLFLLCCFLENFGVC